MVKTALKDGRNDERAGSRAKDGKNQEIQLVVAGSRRYESRRRGGNGLTGLLALQHELAAER